jgi:dipeptide transport system permease protein
MLDGRGSIKRRLGARLWLSGTWLGIMALLALFAPLISPHDPLAQDLFAGRLPPFWMSGSDPAYLLGTDSLGRDVLSRLIHGARIAFSVALVAGLATAIVGSMLGLLAGYMRGWVDVVISRLVDIWMAFPPVLFAILLIAVLGTGLTSIIIAIVVIDWTRFCRVVRAEAMNQSAMDYVSSAIVAGRPRRDILWREILPNVLPTIVALLTLEMGIAVIVEAILSFVNLSISTDDRPGAG